MNKEKNRSDKVIQTLDNLQSIISEMNQNIININKTICDKIDIFEKKIDKHIENEKQIENIVDITLIRRNIDPEILKEKSPNLYNFFIYYTNTCKINPKCENKDGWEKGIRLGIILDEVIKNNGKSLEAFAILGRKIQEFNYDRKFKPLKELIEKDVRDELLPSMR